MFIKPFKQDWEKDAKSNLLGANDLLQAARTRHSNINIDQIEPLDSGCINQNVKLHLDDGTRELMRIYLRNSQAAYCEAALSEKLHGTVPVPKFHDIVSHQNNTLAFTQFIDGILLSNLLTDNPSSQDFAIMRDIGEILGKITQFSFDQPGFFSPDLTISRPMEVSALHDFSKNILSKPNISVNLGHKLCGDIASVLTEHLALLNEDTSCCLVHGDFDPANILVHKHSGTWQIAGVLDWEFAFSGSPCWDMANMLRYAHRMPSIFQDNFLAGLQEHYKRPDFWPTLTHLLNIIALLDCLDRTPDQHAPHRLQDILMLIQHHLNVIT